MPKTQYKKKKKAEAVEMWLNLKLPEKFVTQLKHRQYMVLNKYALAAFYLHPFTDNSILPKDLDVIICEFMFKNLDGNGLEEWDSFRHKKGFFQKLYEKDIKNPFVFWSLAAIKFPSLSKLATKLLQIPAASAQIERLFSSWAHVHCPVRNRLTFNRSKKLIHIFYTLRMKDTIHEDEIEE